MNQVDDTPTHIIFDGRNVQVSSNLVPIFSFLIEIEKEIEFIL